MSNKSSVRIVLLVALFAAAATSFAAGCATGGNGAGLSATDPALALLMPRKVQIQPFTRIASFDSDEIPDGLSVYVRALDQFGDPVKVAGTFLFELYRYQPAHADRKGERLEFWETKILDEKDQLRYWDRTAQMYQFNLEVQQLQTETGRPVVGNNKAVLLMTFNTLNGRHLESEYVLEPPRMPADTSMAAGP